MSTLKVDSITNNGSAVDLTNGAFQIGGNDVVQGYTESATEPSSPTKGDLWWDTANEVLYQYLNGEFKAIGTVVPVLSVADFTYDNVSFSVAGQDTTPTDITFNTDGTKMYVLGNESDSVYQYSLSTGFDISTASYDSVSFSVAGQETSPNDITFNTDGTKMYMVGGGAETVFQYNLSTGFNLSTASYSGVNLSVSGQTAGPSGITFNNNGTKMYILSFTTDSVFQYSLSTGFNLSTASYDSVSFSVVSQETSPRSLVFNTDGTKMYIVGTGSDTILQYTLSTAFDLSTASYDSVSLSIASRDTLPTGLTFNNDDTKMYLVGFSSDNVYQYSTGL